MNSPAELESLIYLMRDFLADQKRLRDRGITLETLHNDNSHVTAAVKAVDRRLEIVVRDQIEHGLRLDRYGKSIRDVKRVLNGAGERREDPSPLRENGNDFDDEDSIVLRVGERRRADEVVTLQAKLKTYEERAHSDTKWWRRQKWHWIMTVVIGLVLLVGGYLIGRR